MEQELRGVNLEEAFQTIQQGIFFGDINQTNDINRFHKVRELSLLFDKNENNLTIKNIFSKNNSDIELERLIEFSEKEFNFNPKILFDLDGKIDELITKLKNYQEKYNSEINIIHDKINNLKKIMNISNEILMTDYDKMLNNKNELENNFKISSSSKTEDKNLNKDKSNENKINYKNFEDNEKPTNKDINEKSKSQKNEDDLFFDAYKKRITDLLDFYNSKLDDSYLKINYIYSIYNLIEKIVKPQFENAKYICSICQVNTKDTFLNCGHTVCQECCTVIKKKNSKCPYCSVLITNVGKLYF